MITFSAFVRDGGSIAQVEVLIRASDPLWELGMPIAINRMEDRFWKQTLSSLARHFGATGEVVMDVVCVDRRRQWLRWSNIRHNALVRSAVYALAAPLRAVRKVQARP